MLSQSPFAPRFLSRRAAASSSASVVPEVLYLYWQGVRIPCDTIDTRGLLDFLTLTANCKSNLFWFLDLPPVWKGLVCSPSLHLLLVFFLVVRRLPLQLLLFRRSFTVTGRVYGLLAIRLIRIDCWISSQ